MTAVPLCSGQGGSLLSPNGAEQDTWRAENHASPKRHQFSLSMSSKAPHRTKIATEDDLPGSSTIIYGCPAVFVAFSLDDHFVPAHGKGGRKYEAWARELA